MRTHVEANAITTLQEGIIGCIIAATYANGYPSAEAYNRILDAVAGRDIFLDTDLIKLVKNQMALHYVLEEEFLPTCCEKLTEEWKRPVFAMVCHLLMDGGLSADSIGFLKKLKQELALRDTADIVEVIGLLHKDRHPQALVNL